MAGGGGSGAVHAAAFARAARETWRAFCEPFAWAWFQRRSRRQLPSTIRSWLIERASLSLAPSAFVFF